jgi:hypothetical protein
MNRVDVNNPTESAGDLWHVQLPNGDVLVMTLDQLDDAFQKGVIHERSHVLKQGTTTWSTLAAVAGLDEPEAVAAPAPVAAAPAPAPVAAAPVAKPFVPVSQPISVPPAAYSMRPVVSEISDFELDDLHFKPRKRGRYVALALVAILGGLGFYAHRFGVPPQVMAMASKMGIGTSQAVADVAAPASPPPAPMPLPSPVTSSAPEPTPTKEARLTEEQRRVLLEADKSRASKRKVRSPAPRSGSKRPKGPPVFHAGHNPGDHDPLNSAM